MTSTDATPQGLPAGQIRFVSYYDPGLSDGTYEVAAQLTVSAPGADSSVPPKQLAVVPTVRQTIVAAGPRFTLDPADVYSQHPPAAASGPFSRVLPHIVFAKRLLPWERVPSRVDPGPQGTPWLALLAFEPDELRAGDAAGAAPSAGYAQTMLVSELLAQKPESVCVPDVTVTEAEGQLRCQVITVTSETFARIVPNRGELPLLAHGRSVATGDEASFTDLQRPGEFSVVMANRFPPPGTAASAAPCVMHLVSLEGFSHLIAGTAPVKPSPPLVKLVSLFSWTFGCLPDDDDPADAGQHPALAGQHPASQHPGATRPPGAFGVLARQLAFDDQGQPYPADALLLRLPFTPLAAPDPAARYAEDRLRDGYLALGYHTRSGDDGFAWYRGPLTPVVASRVAAPDGASRAFFSGADAAMIFDRDTGVFDLSLAAAWSCGRNLALADQSYVAALTRLRQRARDQVNQKTVGHADLPGGVGPVHPALAATFRASALQRIAAATGGATLTQPAPPPEAPPPPTPVRRLTALTADPDTRNAVTDALDTDPDAKAVATWLGQLLLLNGVPFDHLVPDARMLPSGTIRFGYLDQAWVWALVDGALAIGLGTSHESSLQDIMTGKLTDMAARSTPSASFAALGPASAPGPDTTMTGFLLRSPVVTGWPGTTVRASRDGTAVTPLRLEVIRPDVLVAIFPCVPDTLVLEEPHEGLAFGTNPDGKITTRRWDGSALTDGKQVTVYPLPADSLSPGSGATALRPGGARVLNVRSGQAADLVGLIAKGLSTEPDAITSAMFALQLLREPEKLTFTVAPAHDTRGPA
jgi:hypothetical protein